MEATITITKDQIFDLLSQIDLSNAERKDILRRLFPHKGFTDNARLVADITEFFIHNCLKQ